MEQEKPTIVDRAGEVVDAVTEFGGRVANHFAEKPGIILAIGAGDIAGKTMMHILFPGSPFSRIQVAFSEIMRQMMVQSPNFDKFLTGLGSQFKEFAIAIVENTDTRIAIIATGMLLSASWLLQAPIADKIASLRPRMELLVDRTIRKVEALFTN